MVTLEIVKTPEIEDELLNNEQVRSSVARNLGVEKCGMPIATGQINWRLRLSVLQTPHYEISISVEIQ
ncbi:DUF4172 domain-containing protein [Psychrobacter sp. M13]|uniref:DUF4172 domain-containing protein n=1 Tax=Psychrobacter sp. M13 TaxID=3067275 RepID=UPI00352E7659